MKFLKRIRSTLVPRLQILRHLVGSRDYVTPIAETLNHSRFGTEIPDLKANMHPYSLLEDECSRCLKPVFGAISQHSFQGNTPGMDGWNSEPEVSQFLAELVLRRQYRDVAEIGCFIGYSTAHLTAALSLSKHPTSLWLVDLYRHYLEIAVSNIQSWRGELTQVHLVEGLSLSGDVLRQLPEKLDMVFIDSQHDEETTFEELETYLPCLRAGGAIVLHDAVRWPGVRRAVAAYSSKMDSMTFATSRGNGCAVLIPR